MNVLMEYKLENLLMIKYMQVIVKIENLLTIFAIRPSLVVGVAVMNVGLR
jgi:hypothetical protein